jgi:hypothetical protein
MDKGLRETSGTTRTVIGADGPLLSTLDFIVIWVIKILAIVSKRITPLGSNDVLQWRTFIKK